MLFESSKLPENNDRSTVKKLRKDFQDFVTVAVLSMAHTIEGNEGQVTSAVQEEDELEAWLKKHRLPKLLTYLQSQDLSFEELLTITVEEIELKHDVWFLYSI